MKQWRILILFSLLISGLLSGQLAFAYEPNPTHTALAQKSAEVFNQFLGGNLSGEEIGWIKEGARNEDTPPRWINHFYDPITGQGWTSERMGQMPASMVSLFSGMALSSERAAAAPAWAQDQNLQVKYKDYEGNRTWQGAIFNYVNGNKKEALKALGHNLHLIADMAVPAHTRQDTHAGILGDQGEPYEKWVSQNTNLSHLTNLNFQNEGFACTNLNDCFQKVAQYSSENFFSEDTTISSGYKIPKVVKIVDEKENVAFGYGSDGAPLYKIIFKPNTKAIENFTLQDSKIHQSYWQLLSKEAVLGGAEVIRLFFAEIANAQNDKSKLEPPPAKPMSIFGNMYTGLAALSSSNSRAIFSAYGELVKLKDFFGGLYSSVLSVFSSNSKSIVTNSIAPEPANQPTSATADSAQTSEAPASTTGGPGGNLAAGDIGIGQYSLPANTVVAQNKIKLPPNTVMAREKMGGNIVEQITPNEVDIPPAIIEEINPSQATLPKLSPTPSPSPLSFIPGVGSAPSPSPSSDADTNVDTTAPETTITFAPDIAIATTTVTFIFASSENASTFECQLDNASSSICESPKEYNGLAEGAHIFKVAATDTTGNQDLTTAEHSWTVSLSAPSLSNILSISARNSAVISWVSDRAGIFQTEYGTSTSYGFLSATTSASTLNLALLSSATTYHFRILAQDSLGNATTSNDYIFETSSQAGNVVISEIQIGCATTKDEFVDLYNPTSADINLAGWKLGKRTATATSSYDNLLTSFPDKIIPAGGYFLIAHPTGYDGGVPADAVYSSVSYSIADNNAVILYADAGQTIIDLVGFGTALSSESATMANPPNNQSIERKSAATSTAITLYSGEHKWQGNNYDSDNNSNDFLLQAIPAPQNSLMLSEPRSTFPNLAIASAWPTWQKNLTRTGQSAAISLASSTMNVKWSATTTSAGVFSTRPALDSGGNIYIGRNDGLAKYSSGGALQWLYATSSSHSTPLILDDDSVVFRGDWGLFSVDSQGRQKWKYSLGGSSGRYSPPAILSDGTLITTSDEKIYAINQDATLKWIFDPAWPLGASDSFTAPVVDEADNIIMAMDKYIYKISPSGNLIWKQNLGNWYSSLALGAESTLYVSTVKFIAGFGYTGEFYALNSSDGSIKWSDPAIFNDHAKLAPVIDLAGKIYVLTILGFGDKKLWMYNASSTPDWSADLASVDLAAPILTSDGKIYVADQKTLKIFNASDGIMSASFNAGDNGDLYTYFGAIGNDGTIYTANRYTLYAIDDN